MDWYLQVLRNWSDFGGRSRRQEYWIFVLFNFVFSFALSLVDFATGTFSLEFGLGLLSGIYSLVVLVPALAVSFRRLHDTGRSAWWFLIALIPLIGAIVLLVFTVQDSESGSNAYGANPKGA